MEKSASKKSKQCHSNNSKQRHCKKSCGSGGVGQRLSYNGGGGGRKILDRLANTLRYRILCHNELIGGVIGKLGSIINSIMSNTGAWINVRELIHGDEVTLIEISDTRRDYDGRLRRFSPAQEALFMIHDKIFKRMNMMRRGKGNEVVTNLVVSKMDVECLLGKGGKIIQQIRFETKAHIAVLRKDHTMPRCIEISDRIVQVFH